MLLPPDDLQLFFRLNKTLMNYVNQSLGVIPGTPDSLEHFGALPPDMRLQVRDALIANIDLIQTFVEQNPAQLSDDELSIIRSWRHMITGEFYVFRELKKHTVFLSTTSPMVAYGVLALSQPFEELIGPHLPVLTKTVLLPFRDVIVYDGLISSYNISFGAGIRRNLNEDFKAAKERHGIVTTLPMSEFPSTQPALKNKTTPKSKKMAKPPLSQNKDESLSVVIGLIDAFCKEHLNEEYAVLCRKLAEKLARNPLVWMLQVNGFMMDVRDAPREVQEVAFRKGLIPYLPAERQ